MIALSPPIARRRFALWRWLRRSANPSPSLPCSFSVPALALAQSGSPFDTGFTALQNLFTGTIAKVASLIAIVIGGYQFAHGEPGAKKTLGRRRGRNRHRRAGRQRPQLALGHLIVDRSQSRNRHRSTFQV